MVFNTVCIQKHNPAPDLRKILNKIATNSSNLLVDSMKPKLTMACLAAQAPPRQFGGAASYSDYQSSSIRAKRCIETASLNNGCAVYLILIIG